MIQKESVSNQSECQKVQVKKVYFSAWDCQCQQYFSTGRNSTTKRECVEDMFEYLTDDYDEEDCKTIENWSFKDWEGHVYSQGVEIHEHDEVMAE